MGLLSATKSLEGYSKWYMNLGMFVIPIFLCAQTITLSSIDFNLNDNKNTLYYAIKNYDTIIIDKQNEDWIISPLKMRNLDNKTIIFEKGVTIRAKPGAFLKTSDALFKFINFNNLKIYGNDSKLIMNKHEYIDGEWRMGISLNNCKDIIIKDLTISSSGGDGIYIDGYKRGSYSENILIENIVSTKNKRQGISIISAKNLWVKNSVFTQTKGTLPEAGLDIEPDDEDDIISNINFEDCVFSNNNHSGIVLALGNLTANSMPIGINFKNCYLSMNHDVSNRYPAAEIIISANAKSPVKGKVVFSDIMVGSSNWGFLYSRKSAEGYDVEFSNIYLLNICKQKDDLSVIYLEVPDYFDSSGPIGGFSFKNMYVEYSAKSSIITIKGSSLRTLKGVKNIMGDITVSNPNLLEHIVYKKYSAKSNRNFDVKFTDLKDF